MAILDYFKPAQTIRIEDDLPPPVPNTNTLTSSFFRPFANYGPIRLGGESEEAPAESGYLKLSRWDRIIVFGIFLVASFVCYLICIFMFPILSLKPRKFILLWTLGSIFFVVSFAFLQGAANYFNHLISGERIFFTVIYFGSIFLTMYLSLVLKSVLLSVLFAVIQLVAQLYYTVSYFPFGKRTLQFTSSVAASSAESWINS